MREKIVSKEMKLIPIVIFLLLCLMPEIFAQDTIFIRGIVKNGANQPVSDVSVGIESAKELPTYTDEKGEFTIIATSLNVFLNINPGSRYQQKRVFLNNRSQLTIYLAESDGLSGDDPVTILHQKSTLRNAVHSLSTLYIEDVQTTPTVSIGQYLQGRVAGLQVINRSGNPAGGTTSFIRGVNSINASSQPLYVVDGIPISSFELFNSNLKGFE